MTKESFCYICLCPKGLIYLTTDGWPKLLFLFRLTLLASASHHDYYYQHYAMLKLTFPSKVNYLAFT